MSRQIAVRLPDDVVDFIDELVSVGAAASRAAVVKTALQRDRRRRAAERDAEVLRTASAIDDLDGLADHAVTVDLSDLD